MPYRYGALTMADADLTQSVNEVGQELVYNDLNMYLDRVEADTQAAIDLFVEEDTEAFTESYAQPGGGMMQRRGQQTQTGNVKATGSWDVSYPLEDFGDSIGVDDVTLAYMSIGAFNRHIDNIVNRYVNTLRFEMLKPLFNNTARSFKDRVLKNTPTLTIQPLANGDGVEYSPVLGSTDMATENHYIETNYAVSAISNTNNPVVTVVDELSEHFGDMTGGENIVYLVTPAISAKIQALTGFTVVQDSYIQPGDDTAVPTGLPNIPGKIVGRAFGAWISEWRYMPAGYGLALHLVAPAPLKRRVDPAFTGLPRGLALVATDRMYPFLKSEWRARFGFGVGNRLNGVVTEFGTGGSYSIPAIYA